MSKRVLHSLVLLGVCLGASEASSADEAVSIDDHLFRILLADGQSQLTLESDAPISVRLTPDAATIDWEPGTYTLRLDEAKPARQQFHVYAKTFPPAQRAEADVYIAAWREKGLPAKIHVRGRRLRTASGRILDTRVLWISLQRCTSEADATALQASLKTEGVSAWIRPETVQQGTGALRVTDASGKLIARCDTPLGLRSAAVVVRELEGRRYAGWLDLGVDGQGRLELVENIGLDAYLACVLPAEVPALWPREALKAQAVAARTEILAHFGLKHEPEGYNFTATELSRAYQGTGKRHPNTDAAVQATHGDVLLHGEKLVPAVFSATCGGHTENNDTVWSGPPHPALRGVPDAPESGFASAQAVTRRLKEPSKAYCRGDAEFFRWEQRHSTGELSELVNRYHDVGRVRRITLGNRGASGRLRWVQVEGARGKAVIEKELPIRLAFGSLPSALFTLEVENGPKEPRAFTFKGGGRGHGVGLCQNGARGMAIAGRRYDEILTHYFAETRVEVIR